MSEGEVKRYDWEVEILDAIFGPAGTRKEGIEC